MLIERNQTNENNTWLRYMIDSDIGQNNVYAQAFYVFL